MSVGDAVEGYVSSDDLDALVEAYLLSPAPRSRANVILHVVPSDVEHPALADLDDVAHSRSRSLPTWPSTVVPERRVKPSARLPT